jgi:hypothetical protein
MSSLIELNKEYKELMNLLSENEGEITEEMELQLTRNLIESKDKISGYVLMLDRYESEIEFTKSQIKKAKEYIDKLDAQKAKLEKIALDVVNSRGSKLEGNNGNWINKRKSSSLNVYDQDLIPPIFTKIEIKLDNSAIKDALKKGEEIPGARLDENVNLSWK